MAEAEAYLIAAARGTIQLLSGKPRIEQVRPILEPLFQKGIPAKRVQEVHWFGREDDYWLNTLGEAQGFAPDIARFYWATAPLQAHSLLQLSARAIEAGDRDLILLAQESGDHVAALLFGSPAVVGRYNVAPRLRVANKLVLSSQPGGMQNAIAAALAKSGQEPGSVQRIAAARQGKPVGDAKPFASAKWLTPGGEVRSGDFFLLATLADALEAEQEGCGLLISEGPQKSGMVTVFERV